MVEEERNETLYKAVGSLSEIQRRRFLLYYEYEFNFYQIAAMEHCTASAIQKSVAIAKEKVKAEIEEISPTMTDTARKRNLYQALKEQYEDETLDYSFSKREITGQLELIITSRENDFPNLDEVTKAEYLDLVAQLDDLDKRQADYYRKQLA